MTKYITHTALRNIGDQAMTKVGAHQFISDTPVTNHGTDAGPSPMQYLLGSLGSCICISAKALANSMEQVSVKLFSVDVEGNVERYPDKSSKVTHIHVKITCKTNLIPRKQAEFVHEVIHISTIYNTLKQAIPMDVEILD